MSSNTLPNPPPLPICLEKDRGEKKKKETDRGSREEGKVSTGAFFKFPNCLLQFLLSLPTPPEIKTGQKVVCAGKVRVSLGGMYNNS